MKSRNWKRSFFFCSSLVIGTPVAILSATVAQAEDSFFNGTQTEKLIFHKFTGSKKGNSIHSTLVEDIDSFGTIQHHCKIIKTSVGWYCIPLPHPKR